MKTTAIVLAAGSGRRMQSDTKKQFLILNGRPLLYYALKAFEESFVDEIVLVTGKEDIDYCRTEVADRYGFRKITAIVPGGSERAYSVRCGLHAVKEADYVFIQDAARPMLTQEILARCLTAVCEYGAVVVGMPSKDTVKLSTDDGFVESTPDRGKVWTVQTPQVFRFDLIKEAYDTVLEREAVYEARGIRITDDATVLEAFSGHPVKLIEGSYANIKVTTPEDLAFAEQLLRGFPGK